MMLAPPDTFRSTDRIDVSLTLLRSARVLRDRARVHLHAYTSETVAEVRLYDCKRVEPGQNAYAQLRLDNHTLLLPGDRFIMRQFSPVVTIGGGIVLDSAPARKLSDKSVWTFLKTLETGSPEQILAARVARRRVSGMTIKEAVAETGWLSSRVAAIAQKLAAERNLVQYSDLLLNVQNLEALRQHVRSELTGFHKANPLVPGISKESLREKLGIRSAIADALLQSLVREKKLEIVGEFVRLPGQGVVMKDEEAESKKIIEDAFASAGLKVPALAQVLAGVKVDRGRAQKIVTLLLRDKTLVKVSDDLVFHRTALEQLRGQIGAYKNKSSKIDVGAFKDLTGVSRKYAIPLLEYLDRERVTRRVGDERVIL
jgi:selenocysteine-specific elongation factor